MAELQLENEDVPAHWMSYTSNYNDPAAPRGFGTGCSISIVLDSSAHHVYSGVRLVLFYQETPDLNNVVSLTNQSMIQVA